MLARLRRWRDQAGGGLFGRSAAAGLVVALAAGCTTTGSPTASRSGKPHATVAFESIDGPPLGVFQKLVSSLSQEAAAREFAVVSRTGSAHYRVRGYLAAHIEGRRTYIDWVWDVYDADRHRALRIAGVESGAPRAGTGWSAADDQMLARIARAGMDQLGAFLMARGATAPEPAPASPPDEGVLAVASAAPAADPAGQGRDAVPWPPRRPQHRVALAGPLLAAMGTAGRR